MIDNNLIIKVNSIDKGIVKSLAEKCKRSFSTLAKCDDVTRLAVCLYYAENYTKPLYIEKGISFDIFDDTIADIDIWCLNNNNQGLRNYNWIKNHLNLELFKIGRLQFQLYRCKNKTLNYSRLPFDYGDNLIYIHIPQGEKLDYSKCVESLRMANDFFKEYFPDFEYHFYFCESWLLYGENFQFMSPSSNILQFQSLFDIAYSVQDDRQAIERIFGKRQILKRKYPENTTLQRQAKQYMLCGNKLGLGIGIIDKYDI